MKVPKKETPRASDSLVEALGGFGGVSFGAIMEKLNDGFAAIDRQRRITFSNVKFADMLGYNIDELIGMDALLLFDEENKRKVQEELKKRALGVSSAYEIVFTAKSGEKVPVSVRATSLTDEKGAYIGSYAVITDMTSIKNAERELLAEKEKLEDIVKGIGAGLSLLDSDTRLIWANEILQGWFGPMEKLKGRPFYELYDLKDPQKECAALRTLRSGKIERGEAFAHLTGGERRYFQLTTAPIKDENGRVVQILELTEDITEHKRMEEEIQNYAKKLEKMVADRTQELSKSEERYRNLVETSGDAIFVLNLDGAFAFVSTGATKLTGYSRDEVLKMKFTDVLAPEYLESTVARFKKHLSDSSTYRYEIQILAKDGRIIDIELATTPLREGNKTIAIQGIARDVSERKRAEEVLKASEEEWRRTFDSITDLISIHDKDFRILRANKAFVEKFGLPLEEIVGKHCYEVFHQRGSPWPLCPHQRTISSGKPVEEEVEDPFLGGIFSTSTSPIFDKGEIIGSVHVCRDITERKLAEEAIRDSEERYRALAEAAHDMIFIIDQEDRIQYVNDMAAEQFGCTPKMMIGKSRKDLFPQDVADQQKSNLQRVLETGEPVYSEDRTPFPSREVWLGTWLVPLKDKSGNVNAILGISRDITEPKRLEEDLSNSRTFLKNILESSADAIITTNMKSEITSWNRGAERIYGYKEADITGKSILDLYPAAVKQARAKWSEELLAGEDVKDVRTQICRADGSLATITLSLALLRDSKGQPMGTVGISKDITDHVKGEEAIKESEARLAKAQRIAHFGSWEWDMESNKLFASDELSSIFGLAPKPEGMDVLEFVERIHPGDVRLAEEAMDSAKKGKGLPSFYIRMIRPDGTERILYVSGEVMVNSAGVPVRAVGITQDVTERKRAEEELNKTHAELQKKVEELERFTNRAVGRELRMIELKNEIKELEQKLAKYERKA